MAQLKVNLLPSEIILQRRHNSKIIFVNRAAVVLLAVLVASTASILAVRFFQGSNLQKVNQNLALAQNLVTNQTVKEVQINLLKQQLTSIQSLLNRDKDRKAIFNLVIGIAPADIQIIDAAVDKNSNMVMSATTSSLSSIDILISSLSKRTDLISKINLEGLSVGRDGLYRFNLRISSSISSR